MLLGAKHNHAACQIVVDRLMQDNLQGWENTRRLAKYHHYYAERTIFDEAERLVFPGFQKTLLDMVSKYYDISNEIQDEIGFRNIGWVNLDDTRRQKATKLFAEKILNRENNNYNSEQINAIVLAIRKKISIITGSAGTGKTYTIQGLIKILEDSYLCAPTGKAAARIREATGFPARTIHSLLGYNTITFRAGKLIGYNIIVDEASMADITLIYEIIKREPARLILIGDNNQLYPVGFGAPFHDIIRFFPKIVAQLKTNYRSHAAIQIATNAIRQGQFKFQSIESGGEKWHLNWCSNPYEIHKEVLRKIKELDFEQDIIIAPTNGKKQDDYYPPATVNALNQDIVNIINPRTTEADNSRFQIGDRIICTINFPNKDIWNGTTGTITGIDSAKEIWVKTDVPVRQDGKLKKEVLFNQEMIRASKLAYALTVHKTQGSQYRHVIVILPSRDYIMLTRSLLYTACTRAKKSCIIIGEQKAARQAVQHQQQRNTVIQEIVKNS